MNEIEKKRLNNSLQDLLELNAKYYCDLGPGYGTIPSGLKDAGKEIVFVESEWNELKNGHLKRELNIIFKIF